MKKRAMFLVVFMLTLVVIPTFPFHGTTPLTEKPNKAYYTSDDWEEISNATVDFKTQAWKQAGGNASLGFETPSEPSNQSLRGFEETISDDVLYYPDAFMYNSEVVAYEGSTGYVETHVKDSVDFTTGTWKDLNFTISGDEPIEYFGYHFYVSSSTSGLVDLYSYNWTGATYNIIENDVGAVGWHNNTCHSEEYYSDTGKIWLRVYTGMETADIDYFSVDYFIMTLADSDHYAENFSDVSDWEQSTMDDLGTDEDVMYIDVAGDGVYGQVYTNTPSYPAGNYYVEYRVHRNASANHAYFGIVGYPEDDISGDSYSISPAWYISQQTATTRKEYFEITNVTESIRLRMKCGVPVRVYFDYFRISKSDEMGWQHDGSTIGGVTNNAQSDITYTISTDGDLLTLHAENTGGANQVAEFYITLDTTATTSAIDRDYYPMFQINYNATLYNGASYFNCQPQIDGYYGTLSLTEDGVFHTRYGNHKTFSSGTAENRIKCYARLENLGEIAILEINYTKIYSIANYTISQSSTTVDDYLYTTNGTLYSNIDSGEIVLDRDPALNITSPYNIWQMNTTQGTPQISIYTGTWSDYTSNKTGTFPKSETLSDLRLKFTDNANMNGIIFGFALDWVDFPEAQLILDMIRWENIVSAIVQIMVLFAGSQVQWYLTFAGLVMIPVSTLYLVKGGKENMNRDKIFLFLIIFLFGWAFFLGGIMS